MLKAGWARRDITPPVGVDLSGFGGRPGPNEGAHDRLSAKALALTDGERTVALVTADLVGLDAGTVEAVREGIAERLGAAVPVMVACSHTHSGPATPCLPFLGVPDPAYMARLTADLVAVAVEACESLAEAEAGVARREAQVGINRREMTSEGRVVLGHNPGGPVAPYVDVLEVRTEAGRAVLMSHAAHPVTLGGDNLLVSADWPGYAQRFAEEAVDVALFAQGCCGDINSEPRGSFEVAECQGRTIAEAALGALPTTESLTVPLVDSASVVLDVPLEDPPGVDMARAALADAERQLAENAEIDSAGMRNTRLGLVDWAGRVLALSEQGATGLTQAFEVQALRIGELVMVGLPGEVFVEYQLQIEERSPFERTFVFAYTNGNWGYFPTADAFPDGGYEVESAVRYYGTTMFTPACERVVVEGACALLDDLATQPCRRLS